MAILKSKAKYLVTDGVKERPTFDTQTQGEITTGRIGYALVNNTETAQEIKERYPTAIVSEFEDRDYASKTLARRIFFMPELPWKSPEDSRRSKTVDSGQFETK